MNRHLPLASILTAIVFMALLLVNSYGQQHVAGARAEAATVVINELAWGGTSASSNDEWVELYNNTAQPMDLGGWSLRDSDGHINHMLVGVIPAHGYWLLERTDDRTISDIPADRIYTGALANTGDRLELCDASGMVVDTADGSGGWPAGSGSPTYYSMERIDPAAPDTPSNWASNHGTLRNGLDANGSPINGTPHARNSVAPLSAELWITKSGPERISAGREITYTLTLGNQGNRPAGEVRVYDQLPAAVEYLRHTAPYALELATDHRLGWNLGTLPAACGPISFTVTGLVETDVQGMVSNLVTVTTTTDETTPADNSDRAETLISDEPGGTGVLIDALYYDGFAPFDADEAVRVLNRSPVSVDLGGWSITNQAATSEATFPAGTVLVPGQAIWCAREAAAFEQQFGFKPDLEANDSDALVPEMAGTWPVFANGGSTCLLQDDKDRVVDVLVYEGGETGTTGWQGPAVQPWTPSNYFGAEGQILYRKRDLATGLPVAGSCFPSVACWAQDPDDHLNGRKVQYPGWDLDSFFWTAQVTETAVVTVAIGPDHLLGVMVDQIERARESIWIEAYTFESVALADAILERLGNGVSVTILLEGSPVGGIEEAQKWICGRIWAAGGQIYFMSGDLAHSRYRFQHAKFMLIDGRLAFIGSENLSPSSMPEDEKGDGTAGRRGVYVITDAPGVAERVQNILTADIDPAHHLDVVGCDEMPSRCTGLPPLPTPNWTSYTVAFPEPLTVQGKFAFQVVQSPENSLRADDGLLGLAGRAADGDVVLLEEFYEFEHWGSSSGTPDTDPNPRLEAYLDAARRGATVRILLDSFFDQAGDNAATVAYLQAVAQAEQLDLQARLGNPTYLGLHNKMALVHLDGKGYVAVGSINGGEVSAKLNRELGLIVQSNQAYDYLKAVFDYDWSTAVPPVYLPLVTRGLAIPLAADHVLISEVYYAVSKEQEWVEIVNPTYLPLDLSPYKIGDAQSREAFEGMYRFPPGTILQPRQALVIAASALAFRQDYPGQNPDFEFYDTDPWVPTLQAYTQWGEGEWHLSNSGDEVLLLDSVDRPVDVVVYGTGRFPGIVPHPGVSLYTHSLERFPYWLDTNDCSKDMRDWPFPNPGDLP